MIQIFGTKKSFDTKAAQRFFKERRIDFQFIDVKEKPMSKGEFDSVVNLLCKKKGSLSLALIALCDKNAKDYALISYLDDEEKLEKIFENQADFLKFPICRNSKIDATAGIESEVWKNWK